jgi:ribosomal protein S27AE
MIEPEFVEQDTFQIDPVARLFIRCNMCGAQSFNQGDIDNHYCGNCHLFHDVVREARSRRRLGASHACSEWRTGAGVCAVCAVFLPPPAVAV